MRNTDREEIIEAVLRKLAYNREICGPWDGLICISLFNNMNKKNKVGWVNPIHYSPWDRDLVYIVAEMEKVGWVESDKQYLEEKTPDLKFKKLLDTEFRITIEGMAHYSSLDRYFRDDPIYSEYAEVVEESLGLWHRFIHDWLREILISVISAGIAALVTYYLTKS